MTTQSLHGDSPTKDNDNTHSPMLGKTSPMLSYFCVYNPSLGTTEENTKDQILYYTAKKVVPADIKMRQVGLAQALVNFASAFSASKPAQNVHTQKNRMVFLQPEPGFWMYMCVELGILKRHIRDSQGKEKLVTEYLDAQLSDQALEAVLKLGYEQFKLLHGTFSAILYGEGGAETVPNRQRRRSLMHCIEEFFSEWIWKWDFDRLDTMVFSAVFNGVQIQPILRSNYLKIHALDAAIQSKFSHAMDHLLVLDTEEGGLVYRSTSLDIKDVCALRKYILKRVEKSMMKEKEAKQRQLEHEQGEIKTNKFLALKSFTKSLSQSQFLGYFTSALPSKGAIPLPTTEPAMPEDASLEPSTELSQEMPFSSSFSSSSSSLLSSSAPAPEPASASASAPTVPITVNGVDIHPQHGKYLTGLIQTTCIDMNGDEKSISRTEMVHVYLNSKSGLDTPTHSSHESTHTTSQQQQQQSLTEYVLIIYKHRNNLIWSFLLPTLAQETEDILSDPMFYRHLEDYMVNDQQLDVITEAVLDNMKSSQEKR
ncbi:hypothetical protein BDF14DRAFT_1873141 [Spinellus fusiger]|nr:hypothetical protein BDF14DRAFT_1873141 [Spinellus fusiger]